MSFEDFSGYILAGGKSSRMGTDKAFLKIGEKTYLENAVEVLKPVCDDRIKIVLNPKREQLAEKLHQSFPLIFDIFENRGVLGGMHSAFADCQTKFAIILAVDLPFVTSEAIKFMSEIAIKYEKLAAVIPKQNDGRLQPLCGVYRVDRCLFKIENLLESGESNSVMFALTKLLNFETISENQFKSEENFLNINTTEEYKKVKDEI